MPPSGMTRPIWLVDAFALGPFTGNPAGVCLLEKPSAEDWMQSVAMEMNQAETAFVHPADGGYGIRWFTPVVEIALCGHATLASAHVLRESLGIEGEIKFHSMSGPLRASFAGDNIVLDCPSLPPEECEPLPGLVESLRVSPHYVGRSGSYFLMEVDDVSSADPNMEQLASFPLTGVAVTSKGNDYDFVSRFFAPAAGVPEDHATGSAHCRLAPYWAAKLGKEKMLAFQASPGTAEIGVELEGDRVKLIGKAVTTLKGELNVC